MGDIILPEDKKPPPLPPATTCYLCGQELTGEINQDHVPPKQMYAKSIRVAHSPNLLTLPVHKDCNASYQKDEDYFISSLVPLAVKTYSGGSLVNEHVRRFREGREVPLTKMIMDEFEEAPNGIYILGKVGKRIQGERIGRVTGKIARGLYYRRFGQVIPEANIRSLKICAPGEQPPPEFMLLVGQGQMGDYPGVFDYTFRVSRRVAAGVCGMLLWDGIVVMQAFTLKGVDMTPRPICPQPPDLPDSPKEDK